MTPSLASAGGAALGNCLVTRRGRKDPSMNDCAFQSRIEAYHDGELAPDARRTVEQHLALCPACAAELEWLQQLSSSVAARFAGAIPPGQVTRLHAAIDEAIDADEAGAESYPISLYRTGAALSAIAASILILSAVWLNELPTPTRGARPTGMMAAAEVPAWERVAINLRADPLPAQPFGEVYLADARLADWVLQGLAGGGEGGGAVNPGEDHR